MTARQRLDAALHALLDDGGRPPCATDPALWFSDDADERADAAQRCEHCPLARACRAAAREAGERFGIWGGLDFTRRNTTRASRSAA